MTKGLHRQKREIFSVDTCFPRSSQVLNENQPDDAGNAGPRSPSACEERAHRLRHHLRSLLVDEEAGTGNLEKPGRTAKSCDHVTCILDGKNGVTLPPDEQNPLADAFQMTTLADPCGCVLRRKMSLRLRHTPSWHYNDRTGLPAYNRARCGRIPRATRFDLTPPPRACAAPWLERHQFFHPWPTPCCRGGRHAASSACLPRLRPRDRRLG